MIRTFLCSAAARASAELRMSFAGRGACVGGVSLLFNWPCDGPDCAWLLPGSKVNDSPNHMDRLRAEINRYFFMSGIYVCRLTVLL